jgi:lipopolysaccharide transport system permease protein
MLNFLRLIWVYRGFVLGSVKREFQSKYRNSLLGAAWTIINPLAMIFVYTVIFSQVMKARLSGMESSFSYSIYLCSGVITWGLFAEITGRSQGMFIDNANMLKKLSFPRIMLPLVTVINALLNFSIIFGLFLLFLIVSGNFPGWPVLAILPVMLVQLLFAIGLGMVIGITNVFFRDVGQFFGVFLQFWFWLTPIVYPASILPDRVKVIMSINPMYPVITAYQQIFVEQSWPQWLQWRALSYTMVAGTLLCWLGFKMFRRHSGEMVDEL